LRIINWVHTQQQLRLIWLPALRANFKVVRLGFDNELFEYREFVPKAAPVALGN
jgi:hypothetical protein